MGGVVGRGSRKSRKSRGYRWLEEGMRGIGRCGSTVSNFLWSWEVVGMFFLYSSYTRPIFILYKSYIKPSKWVVFIGLGGEQI